MIASLVRLRSGLTDEDVQAKPEARAEAYERVPGLIELADVTLVVRPALV